MLHAAGDAVPQHHPYALELKALLRPNGAIRAQAVFDVEGVPSVVFLQSDGNAPLAASELDNVRKSIWNQNLASVVIEVSGDLAKAMPVQRLSSASETLLLGTATPDGPFSAAEVISGSLVRRLPDWFDVKARVDQDLLDNISVAIERVAERGFDSTAAASILRRRAELLLGQILFVSYLEHRNIVGSTYRQRRSVRTLHSLISSSDRSEIRNLIDYLREDFNGDFLGDDRHDPWSTLNDIGFETIDKFLKRTDLRTGQGDLWNYDFSFIPVELLSGLYESFLSPEEQAEAGAYYTPRHLATLAVDQAFAASPDPLSEVIFDGACGSGILLTTAYRRMIALTEAREKRQLGFSDRCKLLVQHIYGADINQMACRVTAFSLYLSLLEGLDPADIMEAQERHQCQLPKLRDTNLFHGKTADFFAKNHALANHRFTLVISNPPWAEPEGATTTSADKWAKEARVPFVRRQIAGAFAIRALDFLAERGRLCLILPIPQFLAPSSERFVSFFLGQVKPLRLMNFGDLQGLLFPTAENTCHLFVGARRSAKDADIPLGETFEYCVPKADLSLALGRLSLQSADRHRLQTESIQQDPQLLVMLMWGDRNDVALWTRLSTRGTFRDLWSGPSAVRRWVCRKGVHLEDASRSPVSSKPLQKLPFVPPKALRAGSPVLHPSLLDDWPATESTVVGLNDSLMRVFDGPRVLFPDGFAKSEHTIRAVFFKGPATFTHSIGVIAGPSKDESLLRFAAIYLRSSLARYFLTMRGWKMLCERNGVHLRDVETFPFFDPEAAIEPEIARKALERATSKSKELERQPELMQSHRYRQLQDELDEDIFDYFGLQQDERALVRETVQLLMPSIRPRSFKSLDTPAQKTASKDDVATYAQSLGSALTTWRKRMGGKGGFKVSVVANDPHRVAPTGVVKIHYSSERTTAASVATAIDDAAVRVTLTALHQMGLSTVAPVPTLQLVPDIQIWTNDAFYLARPLNRRSWTIRTALRDAEGLVRAVQAVADGRRVEAQ